MKIVEITEISDRRNQINFIPEEEGKLTIKLYHEDSKILENSLEVLPRYSYWVSWLYGWYDTKIVFEINNKSQDFLIKGSRKDFLDPSFRGIPKKIFVPDRTPLCEIMDKNGSDKGSRPSNSSLPGHNYSRFYYELFSEISGQKVEIFELGLGTNDTNLPSNMGINGHPCASLRSWEEFFPNGNIYGADIDTKILVDGVRSKTFYCDQTNQKIIHQMWNHKDLLQDFDIIIEDGLHEFCANVVFLENSIHKIKKSGHFIIEDISIDEIFSWTEYFKNNEKKYIDFEYNFISLECDHNKYDNNLIYLKRK